MSGNLICFSWNADNIPLCEDYLNNGTTDIIQKKGGWFSKPSKCLNPLFFVTIEDYIIKFNPFMVVITTESEPINGSEFHNKFLPSNMGILSYKMLVTDGYDNKDQNQLMMSIYVKVTDNTSKVIQLNKGIIFDDNKTMCATIYGQSKAMCLYVNTIYGPFAFVGVQLEHESSQRSYCIAKIERKFIEGKKIYYSFYMGDFGNTYQPDKKDLSNYDLIDSLRENDRDVFNDIGGRKYYFEGEQKYPADVPTSTVGVDLIYPPKIRGDRKFVVPNYSPNYDNAYVNANISNDNKSIATYQKLFNSPQKNTITIGYHDKIFFDDSRATPNADEIVCIDYSTVVGNPMLMKGEYNSNHMGVIGVYQISPLKY